MFCLRVCLCICTCHWLQRLLCADHMLSHHTECQTMQHLPSWVGLRISTHYFPLPVRNLFTLPEHFSLQVSCSLTHSLAYPHLFHNSMCVQVCVCVHVCVDVYACSCVCISTHMCAYVCGGWRKTSCVFIQLDLL